MTVCDSDCDEFGFQFIFMNFFSMSDMFYVGHKGLGFEGLGL
jgi:hypothetical protein